MPKVSALIPVYGVEKYIERCARSLFEQTMTDIEYIFIDDCSSDRSEEILERIIEEYRPRFAGEKKAVQIERMPTNSGQAAVRRHGLQLCTGEYIIHCDSDDWVETDMYRQMYDEARRINADIVMCGYKATDGKQVFNECYHKQTNKHDMISNLLTLQESWGVWNKLCKKTLYDERFIYPTFAMGEDMVMTMQLVLRAKKFGIVNNALYNYYYNPNSITNVQSEHSRYKHWIESAKNAEIVISVFEKEGLEHEYADELMYLKFLQKSLAGNLARDKKYCREWLEMFQEINWRVFGLSNISYKDKLKFLGKLLFAEILNL